MEIKSAGGVNTLHLHLADCFGTDLVFRGNSLLWRLVQWTAESMGVDVCMCVLMQMCVLYACMCVLYPCMCVCVCLSVCLCTYMCVCAGVPSKVNMSSWVWLCDSSTWLNSLRSMNPAFSAVIDLAPNRQKGIGCQLIILMFLNIELTFRTYMSFSCLLAFALCCAGFCLLSVPPDMCNWYIHIFFLHN